MIGVGGSPTSRCPGSLAAPEAQPGQLCLYLQDAGGAGIRVVDPTSSNPDLDGLNYEFASEEVTPLGDGKVSTLGFSVEILAFEGGGGSSPR